MTVYEKRASGSARRWPEYSISHAGGKGVIKPEVHRTTARW